MDDQAKLIETLRDGGIGILRTDTLYGIVARASDEQAVRRIFTIKQRDADKPLIVLLSNAREAYDRQESIKRLTQESVPTTIIVDSPHAPDWLRHADGSVGYRVPKTPWLHKLLVETGPLVAPSANPQGQPPARTIDEAKNYFGDTIDYYLDGGAVPRDQAPSTIVKIASDGSITRLR